MNNPTVNRFLLITIELFVGLSAVAGGIGLLATGGLGMPLSILSHSPFSSFFWPAMILLFIVGGTHLYAAFGQYKNRPNALRSAAIAAFGLLIWIFTELYMLRDSHWLQALYFGLGILSLVLILLAAETVSS